MDGLSGDKLIILQLLSQFCICLGQDHIIYGITGSFLLILLSKWRYAVVSDRHQPFIVSVQNIEK